MVFVHSRKDTGKTGRTLMAKMQNAGEAGHFDCKEHPRYGLAVKEAAKSRNRPVILSGCTFGRSQRLLGLESSRTVQSQGASEGSSGTERS